MKAQKRPVVVEVVQWHKVGDDPDVVKESDGRAACGYCHGVMSLHGWLKTLEGGHVVCPGDWIITGVKGEKYPCKADIFAATYDLIGEAG